MRKEVRRARKEKGRKSERRGMVWSRGLKKRQKKEGAHCQGKREKKTRNNNNKTNTNNNKNIT